MKQDIHPAYGPVAFRDRSAGTLLLTRSTIVSRLPPDHPTVVTEHGTYPVVDVDVTSGSHPFWTGRGRVVDSEGRVERFNRRYATAALDETDPGASR
ncbi:MAG: type B 50S ribosomal protein L31 [Nocardioidaceae bacterium]